MFSFVVLCILGSNESVYLKVLRDGLCESADIEWLVDYVILRVWCRCSKYQVKSYII